MRTRSIFRTAQALAAAALFLLGCAGRGTTTAVAAANFPDPPKEAAVTASSSQIAVLSGGCFWGMEGVFERLKGVTDVLTGYSGGRPDTAHYEIVSTGTTGHAESVQITYDPSVISYGTLLKIFFSIAHDPTELNFQGPDEGTQYRSMIWYANDAQKQEAEAYIQLLEKAHVYSAHIVTQVAPLDKFYPAEDYHQNFMDNNPSYPYIVMFDVPKVVNLQKTFPQLLSGKYKVLS
jgi:peptide-methionine (S)-S-oxide reductase